MNEEHKNRIANLLERNIFPYNMGDLAILDKIQPETHKNTCAVPTAMLILSTLEYLGYNLKINGDKNDTSENIKEALNSPYYPVRYTNDEIHQLIVINRHGLMHWFYPKQFGNQINGIHKSKNNDLFEQIEEQDKNITSLNVNILSDHFKQFIDNLYSDVKTGMDETGSGFVQTTSPIG